MAEPAEPRDVHDRLIKYAFSRKEAFAVELRHVLPPKLLVHLDWTSLAKRSTEHTDERFRGRISDLHYSIDYVDGDQRWPLHFPVEHQSTFAGYLPVRVVVCAGDIWLEHLRDHPNATSFPVILPILLAQHPARNTPTRLSAVLDFPPSLNEILPSPIEAVIYADDLSGSVLDDPLADPATLALVELTRAFLHAYKNPSSLTEARLATLAPLFDVLLSQEEPLASSDVNALWKYVLHAFEAGSPVRILIEKAIHGRPREMYTTIADSLIAEGEAKGRAAGLSEAILRALEHRAVPVSVSVRERVSSTRDEHQLQQWFDRALSAASADEIFEGLEG